MVRAGQALVWGQVMTREQAEELYFELRVQEAAGDIYDPRLATVDMLRELAEAKRATASAIDVLVSFAIEGEM